MNFLFPKVFLFMLFLYMMVAQATEPVVNMNTLMTQDQGVQQESTIPFVPDASVQTKTSLIPLPLSAEETKTDDIKTENKTVDVPKTFYEKHGTKLKTIRHVEMGLLFASTAITIFTYFKALDYYDEHPLEDYGCVPSEIVPDKYMCNGEQFYEIYNNEAYYVYDSALITSATIGGILVVTGTTEAIVYAIHKRKKP